MKILLCVAFFILSICSSFAASNLSDNIRIHSNVLNYDLQYRVYTPDGTSPSDQLPTIYVTDGQWYIAQGEMTQLMDKLIAEGKMEPVVAIFIDNRNPDDLEQNRRNQQFFCNEDYVKFFVFELMGVIESNYPVSKDREDHVIQGLSFGGFNAACFGLMAYDKFAGISMHSPANTRFLKLLQKEYRGSEKLPLKMFLSFGDESDNLIEGRRFRKTLKELDYDVNYKEVKYGHNWQNWKPLLDDALLTFFAIEVTD
ncbi:MAG: esterase family protein [Kordiimonadaceae bacterium]|nr:esterase family protein [Kordiimonadaceae bacterium]MBT6031393.1 esterase family protein [Kordiimonadaceae bacterium]